MDWKTTIEDVREQGQGDMYVAAEAQSLASAASRIDDFKQFIGQTFDLDVSV